MNMLEFEKSLRDIFGLRLPGARPIGQSSYIAELYQSLYPEILRAFWLAR